MPKTVEHVQYGSTREHEKALRCFPYATQKFAPGTVHNAER